MDTMNYPERLRYVGLELAEALQAQGKASHCAGCGRPFNRARKWRAIKRLQVMVADRGMFSWTALLCGKCRRQHDNGCRKTIERLNREALREAALMATTSGGNA